MKRRASDRGAGETSAKAKALCAGISGNNAKRAGPFILGKQGGGSALGRVAAGGKTANKRHCGMRGSRCVTQYLTWMCRAAAWELLQLAKLRRCGMPVQQGRQGEKYKILILSPWGICFGFWFVLLGFFKLLNFVKYQIQWRFF